MTRVTSLLALSGCAVMLACGGRKSSTEPCLVLPLGIQSAAETSAQTRQASTAACAQFVVVQSVRLAAPSTPSGQRYVVTLRNDSSVDVDLSSVQVRGYYARHASDVSSADPGPCSAAVSGTIPPGSTEDVGVDCATPPAEDDAYFVVRLGKDDTSFPLPR